MPRAQLKNLPKAAAARWEEVYRSAKERGLSDERAAKSAWDVVKKGWKKVGGKWVRKKETETMPGHVILCDASLPGLDALTEAKHPTLFKKALITVGEWIDPNGTDTPFEVTPERIAAWIENFKAHRPALVPVPIGHAGYGNALMNTGYVRGLEFDDNTLWGLIEFTNEDAAKLAQEGSIPAASLGIDAEWVDTETGETYGEAIYHVALTQGPFIDGLPGFEALMESFGEAIVLERRRPEGGGSDSNQNDDPPPNTKSKTADDGGDKRMTAQLEQMEAKLGETQTKLAKTEETLTTAQEQLKVLTADRAKETIRQNFALAKALARGVTLDGQRFKFGLPQQEKLIPQVAALLSATSGATIELEKEKKQPASEVFTEFLVTILTDGLVPTDEVVLEKDQKTDEGDGEHKDFAKTQAERINRARGVNPEQGGTQIVLSAEEVKKLLAK